jgi:hypothetical protein
MKTKKELLAAIAYNASQNIMHVMNKINKIWNKPETDINCKNILLDITRDLIDKEDQRVSKLSFMWRLLYSKQYSELELQYRSYHKEVEVELQILIDERMVRLKATKPPFSDLKEFDHNALLYDSVNTGLRSNLLLHEAFNLGLKGKMDKEVERLKWAYAGLGPIRYYAMKAEQGMHFLDTIKTIDSRSVKNLREINSLVQLCQHRNNYFNYSLIIHNKDSNISGKTLDTVRVIQDNIDCLDNPHSSRVVSLKDGSTAFSIPGGWFGHLINYEFSKQGDDYYFIIHNRIPGKNESNLHGFVNFKNDSGKTYCKTRTVIKVSKDTIKDPSFIQALITCSTSDGNNIYDYIHKTLITDGLGELVKSEAELLLETLYEQYHSPFINDDTREEIRKAALILIKFDKNFHSKQLYGSCVESCITVFEKEIAPSSIIKKLKKFILFQLITKIQDKPEHIENAPIIVKHVSEKIKTLSEETPTASSQIDLTSIHALINRNKETIKKEELFGVPLDLDEYIKLPLSLRGTHPRDNGLALQFASSALKNNKEYVLAAIENNAFALEFASSELRRDKEVLIATIQSNFLAFHFIPEALKRDPAFLLSLVSNKKINPNILELFSDDFRQRREFILAALQRDGYRFKFLPDELKKDAAFFVAALKDDYYIFQAIPESCKFDKKLIIGAVERNGNRFKFLPDELKNDNAFLVAVLKDNGDLFKDIPESLKFDEDLIVVAIKRNFSALKFLPKELKNSKEFGLRLFRVVMKFEHDLTKSKLANRYLVDALHWGLEVDKTIALEVMSCSGDAFYYLPSELKNDIDIALSAVKENGLVLAWMSDELRRNPIIIAAALEQNPLASKHVLPPKAAPTPEIAEVREVAGKPGKSALTSHSLFNSGSSENHTPVTKNKVDDPDITPT